MSKDGFTEQMLLYAGTLAAVDSLFGAPSTPQGAKPGRKEVQDPPLPHGFPSGAFILAGDDIHVVDGDTVRAPLPDGKAWDGETSIRIRLRSLEAPELPITAPQDIILASAGIARANQSPGLVAKAALRNLIAGRPVMVVPTGMDRYGRVLADTYVTPEGDRFDPASAVSIELAMMRLGAATQRVGVALPPARPPALAQEEPDECPDFF